MVQHVKDPVLLLEWLRVVTVVQVRSLAWELPHAGVHPRKKVFLFLTSLLMLVIYLGLFFL